MVKKLNVSSLNSTLEPAIMKDIKRDAIAKSKWPSEKVNNKTSELSSEPVTESISDGESTKQVTFTRTYPPHNREVKVEVLKIDPNRAKVWSGNPRPTRDATSLIPKIIATEGNTQAALVRRAKSDQNYDFELIYGSRRQLACIETGFELLVELADLTDEEADIQAHMENEGRASVDPICMGRYYKLAFNNAKEKTPRLSERAFALKKGVNRTQMNLYLRFADIPSELHELPTVETEWTFRQSRSLLELVDRLNAGGITKLDTFITMHKGRLKTPALVLSALKKHAESIGALEASSVTEKIYEVGKGKVLVKSLSNGSVSIKADKNVPKDVIDKIITIVNS